MAVTLNLSEDVLAAVRAEASRRGVSIEDVITESVTEHLRPRRHLAIAAVGGSGGERGRARDADDLLAEGFGQS